MNYFRRQLQDGSIHTGIQIGETVWFKRTENESKDADPVILWYINLYCRGKRFPSEPEEAKQWLLDHADLIEEGYAKFHEVVRVGLDPDRPISWKEFPKTIRGVEMEIVAVVGFRRVGLEIAQAVHDIQLHWKERLRNLPPSSEALEVVKNGPRRSGRS